MIKSYAVRMLLLIAGGSLALQLCSAEALGRPAKIQTAAPAAEAASTSNLVFHPLTPGSGDGQIALATALLLERYHYLQEPFNIAMSERFFDRYLETFDPQHLHFLQSDIAEFSHYRTNLDRLTLRRHGADTRPACEIFNRFVKRLQQRVAYADELLHHEHFTFNTDDRVTIDRKDAPYPKDLKEAKKLWRERLRFEYLQEKLGKAGAKEKPAEAATEQGKDSTAPSAKAQPKKTEDEEIVETLNHRYHRNLRMFEDWDSDDVLQYYLTTLARCYDPHSDYLGHAQLESFAITMNLSLFGIGAELLSQDGYCTINRVLPGGPAIKSHKIHEKDRIIAVAQSNQPPVDVVDMSLNKAVQLIRGPKGTEVRLTIIPAGADAASRKVVSLIRDEIPLDDQAAKAKLIELPDDHGESCRIGVIDLPSFYAPFDPSETRGKGEARSTTADVSLLLTKLEKENVKGVILDLRRNGGGSLEEAIRLTGLFIKEGPVVQVRSPDGSIEVEKDRDPSVLYSGPLVVLTSRFSASASEIVAGALQDYGRALIVGDSSTHGKGTVQSVQYLRPPFVRLDPNLVTNDPGALKFTIKKFYRPSGASTQLKGVAPDIILPSVFSASKDIGEQALDNPLPWDTIPSASYEPLNLVGPYLPALRKRSAQRLAKDKEYEYIREDIALFKKHQADKTISLNEKERLKEKEEADARNKARDQERLTRKEPPETVYELSLKQARLPGLPPPDTKTNLLTQLGKHKGPATPSLSTNAAMAADDGVGDSGQAGEDKPPVVDAPLEESEHILLDYLALLPKGSLATTAGH